jgi:hypothetical protein
MLAIYFILGFIFGYFFGILSYDYLLQRHMTKILKRFEKN